MGCCVSQQFYIGGGRDEGRKEGEREKGKKYKIREGGGSPYLLQFLSFRKFLGS